MTAEKFCSIHHHPTPVCAACCATDVGFCQCDCHSLVDHLAAAGYTIVPLLDYEREDFYDKIAEFKRDSEMSNREMAQVLGTTSNTVQRWMQRAGTPPRAKRPAIFAKLEAARSVLSIERWENTE